MKEVWKDIRGWEGFYQISNKSRVKSLRRIIIKKNGVKWPCKQKILKQNVDGHGYYAVKLCDDKCKETINIHRLVAIYFIPNPKNLPCINHLNGNTLDNRIVNLEWCTYRENCSHYVKTRPKSSKYLGVTFRKDRDTWFTRIKIKGKCIQLGTFKSERKAASAYIKALKEYGLQNKYV